MKLYKNTAKNEVTVTEILYYHTNRNLLVSLVDLM